MGENKFTKGIKNVINTLNTQKEWDSNALNIALENIKLSDEDIKPYQTFQHDINLSYGRNMIYDNANYKIYAMSWIPGDCTGIHNHEHIEWGAVIFCGDFSHRVYEIQNGILSLIQKDIVSKGVIEVIEHNLIHLMTNSSNNPIMSIHIYGSNTPKDKRYATVYQPEFQRELQTLGSAYINMADEYILSEKKMAKMKDEDYNDYLGLVEAFYKRTNIR